MTSWEVFSWGFGGSIAVEIATAARHFYPPHTRLPGRYHRLEFYVVRVLLAAVAGGFAVAYGIDKPLLAVHIGAATPLMLQAFAQKPPVLPPGPN